MEALHLSSVQSPILPRKRFESFPVETRKVSICRPKNMVFITATMSRPTSEVSAEPSSSSVSSLPHLLTQSMPPKRVSSSSLQYEPGFLGAVPDPTVASGNSDIVDALGSLTNILSSKVYDVAIESPLELATKLSERLGVNFWLKREDLQPVSLCGYMKVQIGYLIEKFHCFDYVFHVM